MTAASAFLGRSAAYLLTDGGTYDPAGTLVSIDSKVVSSNRLRIALTSSGERCVDFTDKGAYSPINQAWHLLGKAVDQADFLNKLPDEMRRFHAYIEPSRGWFQFLIALWSDERNQPETYVIGSPGHRLPGLPPFTLAGATIASPPIADELWPSSELTRDGARAIVEAQRRSPFDDGTFRVAGFAELTTVNATGVQTKRVAVWPQDRIGQRILAQPASSVN